MRRVVTILPYYDGSVLMQLRDNKSEIVFPNKWGFFSGGVDINESDIDAARRELYEELNIKINTMIQLDSRYVSSLNIYTIAFYCYLSDTDVGNLMLREGADCKFVSFDEFKSGVVFSNKFGRDFQIVSDKYLMETAMSLKEELFW